ncbi:hypothetical protein Bbelb_297090 [Branchiostoma belcheri]|nr:hypothetical protein Bbelb_297090 [Branchiostoma belcheri]
MPPDPPTLLAPLALDSRFCARSLRLRARTSFPVNFRKLRAPSQNPKLKTCKLADVDSDSPLFVDALGDQGRNDIANKNRRVVGVFICVRGFDLVTRYAAAMCQTITKSYCLDYLDL